MLEDLSIRVKDTSNINKEVFDKCYCCGKRPILIEGGDSNNIFHILIKKYTVQCANLLCEENPRLETWEKDVKSASLAWNKFMMRNKKLDEFIKRMKE